MAALVLAAGVSVSTALPAAEDKTDQKVVVILVDRVQNLHLTDEQEAKISEPGLTPRGRAAGKHPRTLRPPGNLPLSLERISK
jgi:hypothetical protein